MKSIADPVHLPCKRLLLAATFETNKILKRDFNSVCLYSLKLLFLLGYAV